MDLFDSSQLDSAGKPTQIHDFNPGTIDAGPAKGLFWTTHIATSAVHVDLDEADFKAAEDFREPGVLPPDAARVKA